MGRLVGVLIGLPLIVVAADSVIVSPRPLADAADRLEARYAKPVTYEDPVWQGSGELSVSSVELTTGQRLDLQLVDALVKAYNGQHRDVPPFRAAESKYGLHILSAVTVLDTVVSISNESRTATQHLEALCRAVSQASGIQLHSNVGLSFQRFDMAFIGQAETQFGWGTARQVARQALVGLMSRSATTMSWRLFCQPSAKPANRFCVLNVTPVMVSVTGADGKTMLKPLVYDRCTKCSTILPPPAR